MADPDDLPPIYRRIRKYADALDLKDEAICKRAGGMSRDFIRNIKDGDAADPGAIKLRRIAKVLGVEITALLEDVDPSEEDLARAKVLSALNAIDDPNQRQRFAEIVQSAAELAKR